MTHLPLILVVAGVTYATRIAGFAIGQRRVPPVLGRFLDYVPMAVFAALITPGLGIGTAEVLPRLVGAGAATLVLLRIRHLWAGLGVGMLAYWMVRVALPT